MARERSATTRAASRSDSAPATQAAAISPWEWPTTAEGSTPYERQSAASDTITAQEAGWTTSTRSRVGASAVCRSTSSRSQSTNSASAAAQDRSRSANTGSASRSSTPMPAHCEPWPGKTKTTRPPVARAVPATERGACAAPWTSASSPARRSSRSTATTAARCSNRVRAVASDRPTSSGRSSAWDARWSRSRAAWSTKAASVLADTRTGTGSAERANKSPFRAGSASAGACSMITCALVPLIPNDDTAARRGRPVSGHSRCSVSSSTAPDDQSTCREGRSTCSVRGSTPCRSASTVLITPATPAAACA
ncbi:hypothetical protein SALBM135S_09606 [Streptomyces alboniger]